MNQRAQPVTWEEAARQVMDEYSGAWAAMAGTEDIERWKRTNQYRREMRQGLHQPVKEAYNAR